MRSKIFSGGAAMTRSTVTTSPAAGMARIVRVMRWDGATALVTGASRGIGRAVAKQAAAKGARVGLLARSKDDLDRVLADLGGTRPGAPGGHARRGPGTAVG